MKGLVSEQFYFAINNHSVSKAIVSSSESSFKRKQKIILLHHSALHLYIETVYVESFEEVTKDMNDSFCMIHLFCFL